MSENTVQMKPIWYLVGWVLIVIGVLVLSAGVYYLFVPANYHIELPGMHMSIWWGLVMIAGGILLAFFNRKPVDA